MRQYLSSWRVRQAKNTAGSRSALDVLTKAEPMPQGKRFRKLLPSSVMCRRSSARYCSPMKLAVASPSSSYEQVAPSTCCRLRVRHHVFLTEDVCS